MTRLKRNGWVSGIRHQGDAPRAILSQFFPPRPDDIYIASYPKSGATLMQMMLYQLTTDGAMNFPHIHAVAPSLDVAIMKREVDYVSGLPSPRILKTHARWSDLSSNLEISRGIYLIRHPGDVLISAYNHMKMQLGHAVAFDAVVNESFLEVPPWGTWREHTLSWWPHRAEPNVLFLCYEDVVGDLSGTITTVAAFLGLDLSLPLLRRVREHCDIEFMSEHQNKFDPRLHTILWDDPKFIHRGESGRWEVELEPHVQRMIEDELSRTADGLPSVEGEAFARQWHGRNAPGDVAQRDDGAAGAR